MQENTWNLLLQYIQNGILEKSQANLTLFGEQSEKCSLLPDQGGYYPHPPLVGVYYSPYDFSAMTTSGVLGCVPSGNPVEKKCNPWTNNYRSHHRRHIPV